MYLTVKRNLFRFLEKVVYYNYRIDIILLAYFNKGPRYLIFLFAYFFGCFGHSEPASLSIGLFQSICALFAFYLICTSFFVFFSFQIPGYKDYLYNLLGREWVVEKIGNSGGPSAVKYGLTGVLGIAVNNYERVQQDDMNQKAADKTLDTLKTVAEQNGAKLDPESEIVKETIRTANEIRSRIPKGFLDHSHDRVMDFAREARKWVNPEDN